MGSAPALLRQNDCLKGYPVDEITSEKNEEKMPEPEGVEATSVDDEGAELEAQLAYENLKRRREEKKRKRIIIIVAAALVAVIVGIVLLVSMAGASDNKEEDLVTAPAYKGEFKSQVMANGATQPVNSTLVTPEVDGIIENLQVDEGSAVKEGDVLFTLKNEELDKAVREANADVEKAERAVNSANAAVDEAYADYNRQVKEYNESESGTIDVNGLRKAIRSAEDTYATEVSNLEAARTKLEEAQAKANKRTVTAPVSGTIVNMTAKNGMAVGLVSGSSNNSNNSNSGGSLMQICDLSQMKVTVQVNEVDISAIAAGQKATATFSALPGVELEAQVTHIASVSTGASSDSTNGGGVVNYSVNLLIPHPDPKLKPGMTASVTITTQSVPDSIVVPTSAVQEGAEGNYVIVVTNEEKKETKEVPVEIVAKNNSEAAIKGEVNDGDLVVIGGMGDANADNVADMAV